MEAIYIKSVRDEQGEKFFPITHTDAVIDKDGNKLSNTLDTKLSPDNIKAGNAVAITTDKNDITIDVTLPEAINIIDSLDTTTPGQGALDAYQGKVLKELIPQVVDNLTTADRTSALSANQGRLLSHRIVPAGGATGQVLKKSGDGDHELEWGDAADPNAIVGDGSIMKIIELTYAEYKALEEAGELREDTEYHISDLGGDPDNIVSGSGLSQAEVQAMIDTSIDSIDEALIPAGGTEGQVLKKSSNDDYGLEWGDAADPNAIVGDGTIKRIVELSYNDYITMSEKGQLEEGTEYHINDWTESGASELKANQIKLNNGIDLETAFNNKDIVDEGQNMRLDVAEGNIDAIVGTVNTLSSNINTLDNHLKTYYAAGSGSDNSKPYRKLLTINMPNAYQTFYLQFAAYEFENMSFLFNGQFIVHLDNTQTVKQCYFYGDYPMKAVTEVQMLLYVEDNTAGQVRLGLYAYMPHTWRTVGLNILATNDLSKIVSDNSAYASEPSHVIKRAV